MKTYDELKALIEQRGTHEVFGAAGEGWGIEQNPHELATFLVTLQELEVATALEIGTGYRGGLSRFLSEDMGWQVTTVDLQDYGHRFGGVTYLKPETEISDSFDLVLIDADHSYDAVKADHEKYGELATKVLAFHDIEGLRDCEGAAQYWKEIAHVKSGKLRKGYHEIADKGEQRSGIGYVVLSEIA